MAQRYALVHQAGESDRTRQWLKSCRLALGIVGKKYVTDQARLAPDRGGPGWDVDHNLSIITFVRGQCRDLGIVARHQVEARALDADCKRHGDHLERAAFD